MKDPGVDPPAARRIVWGVLGFMLLAALADIPNRWSFLELVPPVARLWADPDAQYRAQIAPAPYDLLRQADALLPPDAPVLLVTSGTDIADEEYVTFHRALYFLAPRPVWWMAPVRSNGTWQARWWISAPLTAESVRAIAAEKGAAYILAYKLGAPLAVGQPVADLGGGELRQLPGTPPPSGGSPRQQVAAGFAWPIQLAAAVAILLTLGRLALTAVTRLNYRPGPLETWGLAWTLGAGLTSVAMLWLGAAGLPLPTQIAVLTGATLVGTGWTIWTRRARHLSKNPLPMGGEGRVRGESRSQEPVAPNGMPLVPHEEPRGHAIIRALLGLLLAGQVLVVGGIALGRPLAVWDSWVNWSMKARTIVLEGLLTPTVYADPSRSVTLQDYPLFLPQVEAWIYGWLGALDDRLVGSAVVLCYLALLAITYAAVRERGGGPTAALATAVALGTIGQLAGLAGAAFAEVPLALFAAVAGIYLLKWARRRTVRRAAGRGDRQRAAGLDQARGPGQSWPCCSWRRC